MHSKNLLVFLFAALTCICSVSKAQEKLFTNKGKINFASYAELEIIKASSNEVTGILDQATGQFIFSVEISTFNGFQSPLQREHFMENYMETELYSKATFKGKIIDQVDFTKDTVCEVRVKGDLEIHGVKQNRIIKGTLNISKNVCKIECHFLIPLADHNIQIPKIVIQKIAPEIKVDFFATMMPKK